MPEGDTPIQAMVRKLELHGDLTGEDRRALADLPFTLATVGAGHHLVREGDLPTHCCLLVDGYACRYKVTTSGGRQIVSFQVKGDILDLQHLHLATADHHVQTISAATVAWVPKAAIRALSHARPTVADAMWKDTLIDASVFREWVLNVGRRDARSRIAHMLCEFIVRCEAAGLGTADGFLLPMTQEQIADATGLTPVHVNRMLRALDEEGAIVRRNRQLQVGDWARLKRVAEFDPMYLHSAAAA